MALLVTLLLPIGLAGFNMHRLLETERRTSALNASKEAHERAFGIMDGTGAGFCGKGALEARDREEARHGYGCTYSSSDGTSVTCVIGFKTMKLRPTLVRCDAAPQIIGDL